MTNMERYNYEINWADDYKISLVEFMDILDEVPEDEEIFFGQIEEIRKGILDEYDVAVDWSIPLIMVRWFLMDLDDERIYRLSKRVKAKMA